MTQGYRFTPAARFLLFLAVTKAIFWVFREDIQTAGFVWIGVMFAAFAAGM